MQMPCANIIDTSLIGLHFENNLTFVLAIKFGLYSIYLWKIEKALLLGSGGSAAMCHDYSVFVCYHALAVFVVFSLDCPVFMLSGVMRSPNVVSSLFGCFRV